MDIQRLTFNPLAENTLVVSGRPGTCIIADPGNLTPEEDARLLKFLSDKGYTPEAILLTHAHPDHVYGVTRLQERFGIPVMMSPEDRHTLHYFTRLAKFGIPVADVSFSTRDISDGDEFEAGGIRWKVITTPGHSRGSVCYLDEADGLLLTGDTLFAGAIGRTDLEGGDYDALITSIMEKLMAIGGDTVIWPGHGPSSTIATEGTTNPFLEPFNEAEESCPQETQSDNDQD